VLAPDGASRLAPFETVTLLDRGLSPLFLSSRLLFSHLLSLLLVIRHAFHSLMDPSLVFFLSLNPISVASHLGSFFLLLKHLSPFSFAWLFRLPIFIQMNIVFSFGLSAFLRTGSCFFSPST